MIRGKRWVKGVDELKRSRVGDVPVTEKAQHDPQLP